VVGDALQGVSVVEKRGYVRAFGADRRSGTEHVLATDSVLSRRRLSSGEGRTDRQLCAVERCLQVATVEANRNVINPASARSKPRHTRAAQNQKRRVSWAPLPFAGAGRGGQGASGVGEVGESGVLTP
jgi:hypothetical protein